VESVTTGAPASYDAALNSPPPATVRIRRHINNMRPWSSRKDSAAALVVRKPVSTAASDCQVRKCVRQDVDSVRASFEITARKLVGPHAKGVVRIHRGALKN
jgi:hypothetical protein